MDRIQANYVFTNAPDLLGYGIGLSVTRVHKDTG